ncbi:MAG: hypothetical protein ACOY3I_09340 [Verrucomicrobiota bacterium]
MSAPIHLSNGKDSVKIYTTNVRGNPVYQITYYQGGHRQRKTFVSLPEAKRQARILLGQMASELMDEKPITSSELESANIAHRKIEGLDVPLHVAAEQYANSVKLLPDGFTLREAVEFFCKHHSNQIQRKPFAELIQNFTKQAERIRSFHFLVKFCNVFAWSIWKRRWRSLRKFLNKISPSVRRIFV